jgi:hypothetical protein
MKYFKEGSVAGLYTTSSQRQTTNPSISRLQPALTIHSPTLSATQGDAQI